MSAVLASDLHALNLRFLLLVQQTAKVHTDEAVRTFNVNQSTCERIAKMSIDQVRDLAQANTPLFQSKFDER